MKKSLLESNPHLKDAAKRRKAMARNVESSSAVEGIRVKHDAETDRFVAETKDESPTPDTTKKNSQ